MNNCTIAGNDNEGAFPEFHYSLTCQEIAVQHEFIVSNLQKSKYHAILRSTMGILSIIASSVLICILVRSYEGLSTPYHRLLLGMCVCDILLSLGAASFNSTSPAEHGYWVWNVHGNETTCDIQGFVTSIGAYSGYMYICSLCLYHVLVVKYGKGDDEIRRRFEPYFHGVAILFALLVSLPPLVLGAYEMNGSGICSVLGKDKLAPHCKGYDAGSIPDGYDIPCHKISKFYSIYVLLGQMVVLMTLFVIVTSMTFCYKAVKKQESNLNRYGRASIISDMTNASADSEPHGLKKWMRRIQNILTCGRSNEQLRQAQLQQLGLSNSVQSRNSGTSRNRRQSRSRFVFYKGLAYSAAFLSTWLPVFILSMIRKCDECGLYTGMEYVSTCTFPLLGVFNFIVFMYPRVQLAKKSSRRNSISWWQAFLIALKSRGTSNTNRQRPRSRRSNPHVRTQRPSSLGSLVSPLRSLSRKKSSLFAKASDRNVSNSSSRSVKDDTQKGRTQQCASVNITRGENSLPEDKGSVAKINSTSLLESTSKDIEKNGLNRNINIELVDGEEEN